MRRQLRLSFALCAAFVGPLLRPAGLEGGGFSFEGGSSSGKITALQTAASVWGGPEHVRSWRATDNGLEGIAALHNDNVLILDEMGQVNGRVLAECAYMLANGRGKGRSNREGGIRRSQELASALSLQRRTGAFRQAGRERSEIQRRTGSAFHGAACGLRPCSPACMVFPDAGAVANRISC